jgi:hypothetical protein
MTSIGEKTQKAFGAIWFEKKLIRNVKNEGANLNAMTIVLNSIINCKMLNVIENFQATCFGHAFSKACQLQHLMKECARALYKFP